MSQAALSPLPSVPTVVTNLAPVEKAVVEEEEENLPARYNFGYSVADLESGDSKSRQESREGDLVTGSYSVADPDGRIRTVTYTADSEHGFQAVVTYDGEAGPVAIPFNKPTQTVQAAEPVVIAKEIEQPQLLPQPQPQPQILPLPELQPLSQPQSGENDDDEELEVPEVKTVEQQETTNVPSLFDQFSPVPAVLPSVPPRVFGPPQTLSSGAINTLHGHSFPQFFAANSPRFVSAVPGLFNQLRAVPSLQALLHNNNLHQVQALPHAVHHAVPHTLHQTFPHGVHHALPQGVAVRAGAAPLDLSQFTFLSNGQVVG